MDFYPPVYITFTCDTLLRYVNYDVVFSEIPNEVTLAINISNCPCHCEGCHSPYLAEDIGRELLWFDCMARTGKATSLHTIIDNNKGITCVAFMGGDSDPRSINKLASDLRWQNANISKPLWDPVKIAWYSGRQELSSEIDLSNFDFIKLGPYKEELGGLDNPRTNQRLYKVVDGNTLVDITSKFWR